MVRFVAVALAMIDCRAGVLLRRYTANLHVLRGRTEDSLARFGPQVGMLTRP